MKRLIVKGLVLLCILFLFLFFGRWYFLFECYKDIPDLNENQQTVLGYATNTFTNTATNGKNTDIQLFGGVVDYSTNRNISSGFQQEYASGALGRHNYAKEETTLGIAKAGAIDKIKFKKTLKPQAQEETYEKIGSLASWTRDFDGDAKKVREVLTDNKAMIQKEDNSGLPGGRQLNLVLGVVPDKFETIIEELRKVGNLMSFQVTKTSKTNDYKTLMAQRDSLEKNKADLVSLKNKGGKMSEKLDLQERIFNIEKEIGDLGLSIGQFEGTASLCTVLVTLQEAGPAPLVWAFVGTAFHWAVGEILSVFFYLFFAAATLLVVAWAAGRALSLPQMLKEKLKGRSKK